MVAILFQAGGAADNVVAGFAGSRGHDVHPGFAEGQGAGLVEKDHVGPGRFFQKLSAFDQDAEFGRPADGGHRGRGRGHQQGAGTTGHQHGHGPVQIAAYHPGQSGAGHDQGRKPRGIAVNDPRGPGFAGFGRDDEPDHLA